MSYLAATGAFAPAAVAPTDIATITGSATKTVVIRRVHFAAARTAANAQVVALIKRSTADTGGTSVAATVVPVDSTNPAGTATVLAYTANPTVGTAVGTVRAELVWFGQTAGAGSPPEFKTFDFSDLPEGGLVLRGTAQVLAVSLGGTAATGASAQVVFDWIEI